MLGHILGLSRLQIHSRLLAPCSIYPNTIATKALRNKMKAFMTRFLRAPALFDISVPNLGPGELQIKVAYISLNPTDCTSPLNPSVVCWADFSSFRQACLNVSSSVENHRVWLLWRSFCPWQRSPIQFLLGRRPRCWCCPRLQGLAHGSICGNASRRRKHVLQAPIYSHQGQWSGSSMHARCWMDQCSAGTQAETV